ncbi:MAG: DNA cytosine methyltransferase [Bacteroidales bacterium]|nr:DNA cytosine methyltransferase [Bacteroidales bacterium]
MLSDKFKLSFIKWLNVLSEFGYINFVKKLNAKDFNVPQNRDRVFVVSLLDKEMFYFPNKQILKKRLKDILEDSVNKKYYLSEKMLKYFCSVSKNGIKRGSGIITKDCLFTNTLLANQYKTSGQSILLNCSDKVVQIANLAETLSKEKSKRENPNTHRLYDFRGISPTLTTAEGSGRTPYIISYSRDAKGKVIDRHLKDTANTITTFTGRGHNTDQYALINSKIRKLTPKECFRLMGIRENEINILLSSGISDTQLYKMAGNSIVADVLMAIFYKLFINKRPDINDQINLFDYE